MQILYAAAVFAVFFIATFGLLEILSEALWNKR